MGSTEQMNRLVTRLIYESIRDNSPRGLASESVFNALSQHGCTQEQYDGYIRDMIEYGLIEEHPKNPAILICPPGHEAVANQLGL